MVLPVVLLQSEEAVHLGEGRGAVAAVAAAGGGAVAAGGGAVAAGRGAAFFESDCCEVLKTISKF